MSRTSNETTVEVTGRWVLETEKAMRFRVDRIGLREMRVKETVWFPLSQTSGLFKFPLGSEELDRVRVKEWLLIKNGLYDKLVPAAAVKVEQNVYGSRVKEAYAPEPKANYFDEDFEDDIPF
jgi:hypothetical protein